MPLDDGDKKRMLQDHDNLVETLAILRLHVINFDKHIEKDEKQFSFLNQTMWFGMGGLAVIQILIFLHK